MHLILKRFYVHALFDASDVPTLLKSFLLAYVCMSRHILMTSLCSQFGQESGVKLLSLDLFQHNNRLKLL